jgi:hypothetical protein
MLEPCMLRESSVAKNSGKPYEKLTQKVFQAILDQENDVETVTVEHDVTLPGITANSHQIDVLWRFKRGGIEHFVIVQCKDHASSVDQGELFKFKTVLGDIAGQPRGVFVARSGFQEGARDFSEAHGIMLYELREPLDGDWKGRIRNITTMVSLCVPDFRDLQLQVDVDWFGAELSRRDLPASTTVTVGSVSGDDPSRTCERVGAQGRTGLDEDDLRFPVAHVPPHAVRPELRAHQGHGLGLGREAVED